MKILMVNKFLRPVGGAETYVLELGAYLAAQGHEVQYFGMAHPGNTVGNPWGLETATMDFHGGSLLSKASYPLKVIHSGEARRKMAALLKRFRPDVVHINNFNYQLTPSILLALEDHRRSVNPNLRILYTAHDGQLVCPNHQMYRPDTGQICEKCLTGSPLNCVRGRCIHGSFLRSILGAAESLYWSKRKVYRIIDTIICPSAFIKEKLDTNPLLAGKMVVLRNFLNRESWVEPVKEDYILYFGRFSEEKGIRTLLRACEALPEIRFVFAGSGPLEEQVSGLPNVRNVGFQSGEALKELVRNARFTVCPSQWNENCPFSVIESIMLGTPVLGAQRGGIPELIEPGRTGWLFPSGDAEVLANTIRRIWDSDDPERFAAHCREAGFISLPDYVKKLEQYYKP